MLAFTLAFAAWDVIGVYGAIGESDWGRVVLGAVLAAFQIFTAAMWIRLIRRPDLETFRRANQDRLCECGHVWGAHGLEVPHFWRWLFVAREEATFCRRCAMKVPGIWGGEFGEDAALCDRFIDTGRRDRSIDAW